MDLKFNRLIEKNKINLFLILSFFFIFLLYVLTNGFVKNEELSDKIFLTTTVIIFEILYLFFSNKIIDFKTINIKDYLSLYLFFAAIFVLWNYEIVLSHLHLVSFFIFHIFLAISALFFSNSKDINYYNKINIDNLLLFGIISIFLTGLFYQVDYSTTKNLVIISFLSLLILIFNISLKKCHFSINFVFSIIIILITIKVFLLSSSKDTFHYSWFLGPINSLQNDNFLLNSVASQYGYLNILLISQLSKLVNFDSANILVFVIVVFFITFYIIFLLKILSLIKLPITILIFFLSLLIFGKIGYNNLDGSMFIPSSSVFRFLPSLITAILFSNILDKKNNKTLTKLIIFYVSLFVSIAWSFESAFFTLFSLGSFFLINFILNFKSLNKKKPILFFRLKKLKFTYIFGALFLLILYLLFKDKDISLFYEHALNTNASLSEKIVNNKTTFLFLFLLLLSYFILRDSFTDKEKFIYNMLWFSLFVSFSTYFLVRSVDSNIFSILSFLLFIICSMKINSKSIKDLREVFLYSFIFFSIVTSIFSIIVNKEKFLDNLKDDNFIVTPIYLDKNYKPGFEIQNLIKKYKNIPLTLIAGKTIHSSNIDLPSKGYGLPILPLELFNILNLDRKQSLMEIFFSKDSKHLLLCYDECTFYYSNNESNIRNKIFLGTKINLEKLIELEIDGRKESLYLLQKKY